MRTGLGTLGGAASAVRQKGEGMPWPPTRNGTNRSKEPDLRASGTGRRLEDVGPPTAAGRAAERCPAERACDGILEILAHDLRNPLSVTRGYLGLMKLSLGDIGDSASRDIEAAIGGCDKAVALLDQVEELSGLERGEVPLAMERLSLEGIVRDAVASMGPEARSAGKNLHLACSTGPALVMADARLVTRIIADLIEGAVKHASGSADIVVGLSAPAGRPDVLLSVTDDGPAIPEESREAIFDKQRQGELRHGSIRRGRGLALPFAREACRAMGARIQVEDAVPASEGPRSAGGARFVIAFRAAEGAF